MREIDVRNDEYLATIDWNMPLEGSTSLFYIKLFLGMENQTGLASPMYGIYNAATGVREAEHRQHESAKTWADVLTKLALGEDPLAKTEEEIDDIFGSEEPTLQ